jgi:hypothetical protein
LWLHLKPLPGNLGSLKQLNEKTILLFSNGRKTQFVLKRKTTSFFLKMKDNLKQYNKPKTIKSKNNGCGTAPGNLVD